MAMMTMMTTEKNRRWLRSRKMVTRPEPGQHRRAFTASASTINLRDRVEARRLRSLRQRWQQDAWPFAKGIPELSFSYRFLANCSKRMQVFPAAINPADPDGTPISLEEAEFPAQVIEACAQAMSVLGVGRISKSPLMSALSWQLGVVGEGWLIGMTDPETGLETWKIRSINEFMVMDDQYKLREVPMDPQGTMGWIDLDPDTTYAARIWTPDPEYSVLANSPMCALLDCADELQILTRDVRSIGRSRVAGNGLLLMPSSLSISSANDDNSDPMSDEFLGPLGEMMMTPIGDEGVASAVVPGLIRGEAADLAQVRHITLDRPYSALAVELRTEAIGRIANGLDLPRGIVLGLEDATHWNAAMISTDMFRHHVEPKIITEVDSLTLAFLRPALEFAGIDPYWVDRVVMWYDPVELVTPTDLTGTAINLYNLRELSGASLRKHAGFTEEDAPSEIETVTRAVSSTRTYPANVLLSIIARLDPTLTVPPILASGTVPGIKGGQAEGVPLPVIPGVLPDLPPPAPGLPQSAPPPVAPLPGPVGGAPAPPAPDASPLPVPGISGAELHDTVGFAARDSAGAANVRLSRRLSQIDTEYRSKIQVAANAAMTRVLERAGAKLRSKVLNSRAKDNSSLKAAVDSVPNSLVASIIGQPVVAAMGFASSTELLSADWTDLKTQYMAWTRAAQRQALSIASQLGGLTTDDESVTAAQTALDIGVDKGWDFLSNALDAISERLLYNPAPSAQDVTTFDPNTVVPMGDIRVSASIAGGYDLPAETLGAPPNATGAYPDAPGIPIGTPLGSIGNGATVNDLLTSNNMEVESFEWTHNYGGDHPFEPHLDLDGVSFTSFTDDVLAVQGDYPDAGWYVPGQIPGCCCDFASIYQAAPDDGSGDASDADSSDDDTPPEEDDS